MFKRSLATLLLVLPMLAQAAEWRQSAPVARLFQQAGVTGTFVVYDVAADVYTTHDRKRAETRFIPASTFKIPNSLIALAHGAVASVDEIVPYDGRKVSRPEWGRAMGLRDAIRVSNVPVYQEMARRVGLERMRSDLVRMKYGNMDTGTVVDRFWLDGPLKISAVEQTAFLVKLAQGQLPYTNVAMAAVREICRQDGAPDLYAKTGWGVRPGEADIGWWVGWLKKDGKLYAFALNMDLPDGAQDQRVSLAKAALRELGLL
jgi:beta-lactamase class D